MNSRKSVSVVFELKEMSLIVLHSVFQEKSRLVLIEKPNMKALTNPSDTVLCVPFSPPNNSSELFLEIKSIFRKIMGLQFREQRVSHLNQLAKVVPVKLKSF